MKIRQGTGGRFRGRHLAIAAAAFAASSSAQAVTFDWGDWSGSWDNTISYGISWRAESPDLELIGKGNGGTGEAILTDDAEMNFDKGDVFSNIIKGTSELEIDNGQFGAFGRIKYWYDFELENGKQPHGHVANNYQPDSKLNDNNFADYAKFSGLALLDLFAYGTFDLGDNPLDLRVGRQVVNWGESLFIQGINVLNPIDVSAVRRPGVEVKEALLPVALVYANFGLPAGWSVEAFYQFKWEETVIDACGTYFSTADFAAKGCNNLLAPEQEWPPNSGSGFYLPDVMLQGVHNAVKDPITDEAKDSGQFGLAVRNYVEAIDTEFGLYYQRLHNRTPVINSVFDTAAIGWGSILGGTPVPSSYQIAYPEDVDIWGLSFATNIGVVAWSGEVSLKQDLPVSVNGTTQLTAQLGILQFQGAPCAAPDPTLLIGQFGARACDAWNDYVSQGAFYNPAARSLALGYDRFDVTQAQTTLGYLWEQALGAQRISFAGEFAWIGVSDLPSISEMPYGRNPIFGAPTNLLGPSDEGFVTSNSWGYRLVAIANYSNVFGTGVELSPRIVFSHDVNGTSPTPTFLDGRKAVNVALSANYLTRYRASISYTTFWGGTADPGTDRDFYSFTVAMDF